MKGDKSYSGFRHANGWHEVRVHHNGDNHVLEPGLSLKLANHSPTGFAWSYGGSGPAQLALAILLDFTGSDEIALQHYQDFKWQVVAKWGRTWTLTSQELRERLLLHGLTEQDFARS